MPALSMSPLKLREVFASSQSSHPGSQGPGRQPGPWLFTAPECGAGAERQRDPLVGLARRGAHLVGIAALHPTDHRGHDIVVFAACWPAMDLLTSHESHSRLLFLFFGRMRHPSIRRRRIEPGKGSALLKLDLRKGHLSSIRPAPSRSRACFTPAVRSPVLTKVTWVNATSRFLLSCEPL
jgi:hypothetical protein